MVSAPDLVMEGHLNHIVNALVNETRGTVDRDELRGLVDEAYEEVAEHARIETFLPILTMRQARTLLEARQMDRGERPKDATAILLVCGHNSGRSQVAAALIRFYAAGHAQVVSAGQDPDDDVKDDVVAYMREHGVELTDYPKRLRPEYIRLADHIILVGSNEAEIDDPTKDVERWSIPHTSGLDWEQLGGVIHEIDAKVRAFVARALPDVDMPPSIFEQRP